MELIFLVSLIVYGTGITDHWIYFNVPSGIANINSSQHISLAAIFEGKHISLVICVSPVGKHKTLKLCIRGIRSEFIS